MGYVEVVDRGGQEIVVFLSGSVDDSLSDQLATTVDRVAQLEQLNGSHYAVVDMHRVTALTGQGLVFLHQLIERGRRSDFHVSFAAMSGPAHRAVEAAGWDFVEPSPPLT